MYNNQLFTNYLQRFSTFSTTLGGSQDMYQPKLIHFFFLGPEAPLSSNKVYTVAAPGVLNVASGFYSLIIIGRYPLRFSIFAGSANQGALCTLYPNIAMFIGVIGLVLFILVFVILFCAPCISRLGWQSRSTVLVCLFRLRGAAFFGWGSGGWVRGRAIAVIVLSFHL